MFICFNDHKNWILLDELAMSNDNNRHFSPDAKNISFQLYYTKKFNGLDILNHTREVFTGLYFKEIEFAKNSN